MNGSIKILIWVAVVGALFGYLWWQGYVRRFADYCRETMEELKKCSWPTSTELKGSTALIIITIALLGAFTVAIDQLLYLIFIKL